MNYKIDGAKVSVIDFWRRIDRNPEYNWCISVEGMLISDETHNKDIREIIKYAEKFFNPVIGLDIDECYGTIRIEQDKTVICECGNVYELNEKYEWVNKSVVCTKWEDEILKCSQCDKILVKQFYHDCYRHIILLDNEHHKCPRYIQIYED
jgi:hypothetical protein